MNKAIKAAVVSIAMILAAAPATGSPRERTETVPYETPGTHFMDAVWVEVGPTSEAVPMPGERTVSVVLQDESGRPVAAALHQGDHDLGVFCGETGKPVRLVNRKPVHVHVYNGPGCSDVSVATQGTATFTFFK